MSDFRDAIAGSNVVFIIGTGMSALTSDRAPTATWVGLIRSGASRAGRLNPKADPKWQTLVDTLLKFGSTQATIAAGGMVATALRELGPNAMFEWLKSDIGGLEPLNPRAAKALLSYPFPILTTNYDTLLETVSGREARDWTDSAGFHEVVTRASQAIGHLHGVWDKPESIVLSETDYANIRRHPSTQALERAISALKSLVYVGFGSGLSDPNFSELLAWHAETFPESRITHYRLCRTSELDAMSKDHAGTNVQPVAYGDDYEDLAEFLETHSPDRTALTINDAGLALDIFDQSRQELRRSITQDSVLVDAGFTDADSDLTIPPVLLPIAHANYVRERLRREKKSEVERVDPAEEVSSHDFFVLVGDEGSGLTTAVKWLTTEASALLGAAAPLFVRFSDCRHRQRPLRVAISRAAQASGIIRDKRDPVPAYVVGIDNVNPSIRIADAVLGEAVSGEAIVTVIGCQQGSEDELVSRLRRLGVTPRVLYMGRLRRSDIAHLAEKLAPGRGLQLADEVVKFLDAEGLRRTPMSVALMLFLILQGNPHDIKNQTSILDAYASLLINLGDPHTDTTKLTENDLQAVLSNLAEYMIWEERASLPETEAEQQIAKTITRYAWTANAREAGS